MPRPDRAFSRAAARTGSPRLVVELLEDRSVPAVFVVNTTADTVDATPLGDGLALDSQGKTSLRAAVMEANALSGADTIQLPAGTFFLSRGAAIPDATTVNGDLDISQNLTITGAGASSTKLDAANNNDRVFDVLRGSAGAPTVLNLSGVTVMNGRALGTGTSSTLSYATAPDSGSDISTLLGLTSTLASEPVAGIAAEQPDD